MYFIIGTILYYLPLSLAYLSIAVYAYSSINTFSISCGYFGNSSDGDQTWTGDINSKLLLATESQQSVADKALAQSPSTNSVPYTTARLSYSNFTYSFPVTAGQKFIRLYFYPTSYEQGFDRSKALFSVTSGTFTLLKDFNASLTADADNDPIDTIFREYIINVDEGQRLNVTFSPSTIQPDLYAFVNGIEILSMPTNLYYTDSGSLGFELVGWSNLFNIANNSAIKTEYRLNVGGSDISPRGDTGLLRSWENDQKYVTTPSALPVDISGTKLTFTQVPNYTAPDPVYRTARSMGANGTFNKISNLTWELSVDSGFTYMLRLHFCELDPLIELPGDRVFYIYIDDNLAEDAASVLKWSKEKRVPVYRDYAVHILGNGKKYTLSLKLHPHTDVRTNTNYDAFLNGLEIFRISDPQSNNLAGPNPDPLPSTPVSPPKYQSQKNSSSTTIIGVVAGVVASVVLLFLVVAFFLIRCGKKVQHSKSHVGKSDWDPFSFTGNKSTQTRRSSSLPSDLCRYFAIAEIRAATNNFDELLRVGVGGFGNVYKGYIDDNTTPVAIKRLKPGSQQGSHEFKTEIQMLSQLRHLHLVSLIGYCNENNEMILVYDYMARGTLRDHLYNTDNQALSWKQRLKICIGAAHGLHYLHAGAKHNIIHRDVKSTNILLDEGWVAKVSDFGLSKIGPTGISRSHITTVVKGSFGYLDPEYYMRQRLTLKSDVYAFGVVLLEVLCGRPPFLRSVEKHEACLDEWVRKYQSEGKTDQTVDPALKGTIAPESLKKFSDLAMDCLLDDGNQRPPMNEVVWGLEFALKLQETAEDATLIFSKNKDEEWI